MNKERVVEMPNSGDRVQMRKKHPCGSDEWIVYRVGGDIGLRCVGCERRVILPYSQYTRQVKQVLTSSQKQLKEDAR